MLERPYANLREEPSEEHCLKVGHKAVLIFAIILLFGTLHFCFNPAPPRRIIDPDGHVTPAAWQKTTYPSDRSYEGGGCADGRFLWRKADENSRD